MLICSITALSPVVTMVILEKALSIVGATVRLSMLYPLPEKSPDILDNTPASFFTNIDKV